MSTKEIEVTGTTVIRIDESQRWAHWFAFDADGTSYDTGTSVLTDARRIAFERSQAKKTEAPAARYEIVSGPERARAGHQRRRAWDWE